MMDYDYRLVQLSLLTAFVSSLAAFSLATSLYRKQSRLAGLWLATSAITLGSAVWVTHFAGILALTLPKPASYNIYYLALSWAAMTAACWLTLRISAHSRLAPRLLITDSVFISLGISGMYYASLHALRIGGSHIYSPELFALFVSILSTLAMLMLLLLFWVHTEKITRCLPATAQAAVLVPAIVGGWYYLATATSGFSFSLIQASVAGNSAVLLAMLIAAGAIGLMIMALIFSLIESRLNAHALSWNQSLKNTHHELSRMALLDTLTQLPNRRLFQQHLEIAIGRTNRMSNSLAVAFIDLDQFKPINDALGHH
ncbi:MAG TPA: diguanylate cyclase, partial [Methylophilaceae bacterium]|nr:diguanylate cyclase [Methylophilaceae bacterium]